MAVIDVDRPALRAGVAVAAAIAVPVALAYWLFDDVQGVLALFTLLVLAGLVIGSAVAGSRQRTGAPLAHGLLTSLVVFGVLTLVRVARLLLGGDGAGGRWLVSNLLLSLIAGTVGGLIGGRRSTQRAAREAR